MYDYIFKARKNYRHCYNALKDRGLSESLITFLRSKDNKIFANEKPISTNMPIKRLDEIRINLQDDYSTNLPKSNIELQILYEDDNIIVINKPAGLSCIPCQAHYEDNLASAVCQYMKTKMQNFVYRVTGRLDKETSGIVVIAKNKLVAENIEIEKIYIAICKGNFPFKHLEINLPISTIIYNGINQRKRVVLSKEQKQELISSNTKFDEKSALTTVRRMRYSNDKTLIKLSLKTGRTHQIRVHMSTIGYPLVGDRLYSNQEKGRTLLHCYRAKISIPIYCFHKTIIAPAPNDFTL